MKTISLILLLSVISFSCQKDISSSNGPVNSLPTLTTTVVTAVTNTAAISGGNISDDGGSAITARGVCWSTSTNPVVTGNHTIDGAGAGSFTSNISGLTATTLYYVRAYATNANGTAYGNEISFTTSATAGALPTVTTSAISAITQTTASGGGNVTADGGSSVTARGICWSTSSNPVITSSHTTDAAGLGAFTSAMTALTASTTYYVRAYATNVNGTAYGNELSFTTSAAAGLATLTTATISSITSTSASGGGNVLTDGGSTVTARGVCWSTTPGPIVSGNHTSNGTGLGAFTSSLTSLASATTYYVRAYATNANGTSYGNEQNFTTLATAGPDIYAVGNENNGSKWVAKYWKNGIATSLADGTTNSNAISIFVAGTDVYIAGYVTDAANNNFARYWKNGVVTNLGSSGSNAESIFVSGTDVYVAGGENGHAVYWKNGVSVTLPNPASSSWAQSIFVSGTDVYVCGYVGNFGSSIFNHAYVWKNGVGTDLSIPNNHCYANAVTVVGSDVFVGGYTFDFTTYKPTYWKNAVLTAMPASSSSIESRGLDIAVNGTDVYLSGFHDLPGKSYFAAAYWKNTIATNLTNGNAEAGGYSIKIFNGDVYVGGGEEDAAGIGTAKVWKNGVATSLTDGTHDAVALSIWVQ